MASPDDTEGSLTPVDFIQLQQYMECEFNNFRFIFIIISMLNTFCRYDQHFFVTSMSAFNKIIMYDK